MAQIDYYQNLGTKFIVNVGLFRPLYTQIVLPN